MNDADDTPITCVRCIKVIPLGSSRCENCGRSISSSQLEVSRKRSSGTFRGLEEQVRELARRCRTRRTDDALDMAARCDEMVERLRRNSVLPPTCDESTNLHLEMLKFVPMVEEFLSRSVAG